MLPASDPARDFPFFAAFFRLLTELVSVIFPEDAVDGVMDDRVDIAVLGTKNEAAEDAVPRGESGDGFKELAECEVRDERGPEEGVDSVDVGVTGGRGERGELFVVLELFGEAGADNGGLGEIGPVEDAGLRSLLAAPAPVSEPLPLALGSE